MIQLTLTLKMTTTQVVKSLVTVNNNNPIQDDVHPQADDYTQPTYRIYSINRPRHLLNFWTLRVGAYLRLGAY